MHYKSPRRHACKPNAARRLDARRHRHRSQGGLSMKPSNPRNDEGPTPQPWITKQRLPHIHTPGMNRYRISEVETWLREQYGWPQDQ
jgi:hypothetical protein